MNHRQYQQAYFGIQLHQRQNCAKVFVSPFDYSQRKTDVMDHKRDFNELAVSKGGVLNGAAMI